MKKMLSRLKEARQSAHVPPLVIPPQSQTPAVPAPGLVPYESLDWMLHSTSGFDPDNDPGVQYFRPGQEERSSWPG